MGDTAVSSVDDELRVNLQRFVVEHFGEQAVLDQVEPMLGGHAGLTYGFRVVSDRVSDGVSEQFIIKLAPRGVRREGNTDVYRTAPLLRALVEERLPVPQVPFAAPDEEEFGVPYIVMQRLAGREFFIWDPHPSFARDADTVAPLWRQMAEVLPRLHGIDWQRKLPGWEQPRTVLEEISRWQKIYAKAPEPAWLSAADRLRQRLLQTLPGDEVYGIVHGDYQPGNGLFERSKLTGIIDWELVRIGAVQVDIGWLMFSSDHSFWADGMVPHAPLAPDELADIYQTGMGKRFANLNWYQALAAYQLGSIACLNVRLHRKRQRVDPIWERFATTVPQFFARAMEII